MGDLKVGGSNPALDIKKQTKNKQKKSLAVLTDRGRCDPMTQYLTFLLKVLHLLVSMEILDYYFVWNVRQYCIKTIYRHEDKQVTASGQSYRSDLWRGDPLTVTMHVFFKAFLNNIIKSEIYMFDSVLWSIAVKVIPSPWRQEKLHNDFKVSTGNKPQRS
ncbi:hypothetical protein NQD34_001194 [Periophthalmus magnuspinnatus]|nr:hypothetical protein NQD34_001194 [Periophthalmus magnuspinnatus]